MSGLKADESGQWLLLGAMILAIGLAVLIVFVNQAALAGHSASASIMDFPKNDIREFRSEIMIEGYLLGQEANIMGTSLPERRQMLNTNFTHFAEELRNHTMAKGSDSVVKYSDVDGLNYSTLPGGQSIDNLTIFMHYNYGDTQYNETVKIYLR